MWRLWTPGWGLRDWWYWFTRKGLPLWAARHLPARIALWAFILVYAHDGQSPGPDYSPKYAAWASTHGIND